MKIIMIIILVTRPPLKTNVSFKTSNMVRHQDTDLFTYGY